MSFGERHLGPLVSAFLAANPDVEIDLVLDDRFVDILAEGFDVAVRIAELHDSSLVARRLCASRRVLCAAPGYSRDTVRRPHPTSSPRTAASATPTWRRDATGRFARATAATWCACAVR